MDHYKHAYLIMAYKDMYTLTTLLRLLDDEDNDIYLHIDVKSVALDGNALRKVVKKSRLFIYQKINVRWGDITQIECEMLLFKMSASYGHYEYYHLMSGADLPIKSQEYIHKFFHKNIGKQFIAFKSEHIGRKELERVSLYHFVFQNRRATLYMDKCFTFVERMLGINRCKKEQCIYQKGHQWVSLTDEFVRHLLKHEAEIKRRYRYTICSDEIYKQTFFLKYYSINDLYLYPGNENDASMRMIDWNRGGPYVWHNSDYEQLTRSPYLFARKFDSKIDKKIIERIFEYIYNEVREDINL